MHIGRYLRGKIPANQGPQLRLCALLIAVALMPAMVSACVREVQSFRHSEADLSSINRIAVIPFENFTNSQFAGEKVSMIYITELLSKIDIEVVEPGEVAHVLQKDGGRIQGELSQSEIKAIGSSLRADTLVFGTVQEYGTVRVRNQSYPVVTLNVRWVDVQTGTIIFMGTDTEEGSPRIPVVDIGEEQLYSVLASRACSKLIDMVR